MFDLVRQWYRTKVNALKAQNTGYEQLFSAVAESQNQVDPGSGGWSKIAAESLAGTRRPSTEVTEASNIVSDIDNLSWLMTSRRPEYKGHLPGDQEAMIMNARRFYRFDPNGRAMIKAMVNYIMGPGLKITPQSKDPRVHRLWREFWNADRNRMQLRQFEIPLRLLRDGELLIQFFNTDENGATTWKTTIRFRDPLLLRERPVTPGTDPATGRSDYRTNSRLGVEVHPDDPETVVAYYVSDPWDLAKITRIPADQMLHIKGFADLDQKRGESFMQPVMEMYEHYRQWMKYRILLNKVRAAVVMVRKVTGGTQADISRMAQGLSQSATNRNGDSKKIGWREGTILNANAGVDYDFKSPNINASDVTDDGRRMKLEMVASGQMPEYILGDASNSNMASTLVSEAPFVKEVKYWQTFLEYFLKQIFKRVISAAVQAGKLQEPPEDDIFGETDVTEAAMPEADAVDPQKISAAITKAAGVRPDAEDSTDSQVGQTDDVDDDGDPENDLTQLSEHEAFYGCDVQWPEIVHREIDKETTAIIAQRDAGLVSDATASQKLGYDYDEEVRRQQLVMLEAEDNPFKQAEAAAAEQAAEIAKSDKEAGDLEKGDPEDAGEPAKPAPGTEKPT